MSKPQHFKIITKDSRPTTSLLSDQLDAGWDTVSILRGAGKYGGYTIYLKRIAAKETSDE